MALFTAQSIIDQARGYADRDGPDDGVTNVQLLAWLNTKYFNLRRRIGEVAPDLYTGRLDFTIASGSNFVITANDFSKALKLERLINTIYVPLQVTPLYNAESISGFWRWRFREGSIDVFPGIGAPGDYRLTYLQKPAAPLALLTDDLDLPEVADDALAWELATLIALRVADPERSPETMASMAAKATSDLVELLSNQYAATPQQIAEVW